MITLLTFTLTLPFLLILYIVFSLFLKPIVKINFYKKQGCDIKFFPLMGTFKKCFDSLASQDDFHGYFKTEVQKNPKVRVLGGNLIDKAQLFLVDHELIKEFFQQQDKYYKSPQVTDMLKVFMGNGLAAAEGPIWKRHRKILGSAFHFELLKEMISEVIKIAEEIFNKQANLTEINVTQIFEAITGEVVGRLFFGAEFSQYKIRGMPMTTLLSSVVNRVGSELSSPSYMIFGVKGVRARVLKKYAVIMDDVKELQDFARTIIEKKQAERAAKPLQDGEKKTFIDILLDTRDKTADEVFSVQDTIDEFITFFAGGMDTTGHLLGMATYYLHQNPENKAKLMAEVNKYFADPSAVGLDDLNKMEFMTAFLKETLRMSTPAPIITDRVASEDHCLKDLKIKKGTLLNVSQMASNFHPEYHEDPYSFKPERWLEGGKTREMIAKNPYAFIPFSAGAHNCIGQHLAMNEARAIFSLFLKKFDFVLTSNYKLKMRMGLLYEPVDKLNFKLIPKHC